MKINAGEIRVGMLLEYKNDLWQVLKTQHVKPSRLLTVANQNNEWKDLKMRKEEILKIESQRFKLEKIQVLAMRLKYEIENVILKIALPKINSPDIIERFSRIEKLERTILRQAKG